MNKYVKVEWPDSQKFEEFKDCFIAIPINRENYTVSGNTFMVPEDLYKEVMYKLSFPKRYRNTNLGTIICYENYAVVDGDDRYYYDLSDLKKGDKLLVNCHDGSWVITTCKACSYKMPIIMENDNLLEGINCTIIGRYA